MRVVLTLMTVLLPGIDPARGQESPWKPAALAEEAVRLRPQLKSELANRFLDAAAELPDVATRTVWVDRSRGRVLSASAYAALPEAEREGLAARECDAQVYYCSGYGSPLIYARPLEVLGSEGGLTSLEGRKILDFGHGMIGQLRMMAELGAEVHGVDVNPLLPALYDRPEDRGPFGLGGTVTIHSGRWPAEAKLAEGIGGGYDIILSKNVLKRGYVHPTRPAEPRMLIDLGVDDAGFLAAVHGALKPGGLFLIYNLCPPKAGDDKPYIPWADGECPFPREAIEAAGFEVVRFDVVDDVGIRALLAALEGGDVDASKFEGQIFAWYTLLRRR